MPKKKIDGRGGARPGAGRPAHELGVGIMVSVRVPYRLLVALRQEALVAGTSLSAAVIARLIRGKRKGEPI